MQLYVEQGYDATTVAEIAARAGLTERTFFRHFADKREVLFSGSAQLAELLAQEVARAPKGTPPIDAVGGALEAAGALIQERGEWSKQRQAVIAANPELRERELIKLASLAEALARSAQGPWREGAVCHAHCRGRSRGVQGGVHEMGGAAYEAEPAPPHPPVARRSAHHHGRPLT